MKVPRFWLRDGLLSRTLAPLGAVVAWSTARRLRRPGWRAPISVLCCGNANVGGAGKTTVVLDVVARLTARGVNVHCLTRGYGGTERGPLRVDPSRHGAAQVGDEPLLLAALAPTWVGADRAASARLAVGCGAEVLVMDDGLQNPGLVQDEALLIVDGAVGFGNGRVVPAGPLREPAARAASRSTAAVLIGDDVGAAAAQLPDHLPVLRARLEPDRSLAGIRVVAFAGIARPAKFHHTLTLAGAGIVEAIDFPDHHLFTPDEIDRVVAAADRHGARLVTTPKDAVRLDPVSRSKVEAVGVKLVWEQPSAIEEVLDRVMRPGQATVRAASGQ